MSRRLASPGPRGPGPGPFPSHSKSYAALHSPKKSPGDGMIRAGKLTMEPLALARPNTSQRPDGGASGGKEGGAASPDSSVALAPSPGAGEARPGALGPMRVSAPSPSPWQGGRSDSRPATPLGPDAGSVESPKRLSPLKHTGAVSPTQPSIRPNAALSLSPPRAAAKEMPHTSRPIPAPVVSAEVCDLVCVCGFGSVLRLQTGG